MNGQKEKLTKSNMEDLDIETNITHIKQDSINALSKSFSLKRQNMYFTTASEDTLIAREFRVQPKKPFSILKRIHSKPLNTLRVKGTLSRATSAFCDGGVV